MNGGARPRMIVLAGPNGAGKTTFSGTLPTGEIGYVQFPTTDIKPERNAGIFVGAKISAAHRKLLKMTV